MKRKPLLFIIAALAAVLININNAHAYLDPGTSSAILQGVIAGVVAIGVAAKLYWHRLLKMLGFRKDVDTDQK